MTITDSSLNISEVLKHLPHRYPFLLVDRVLEIEVNKRIRAIKNVTINEPFFNGHFPNFPVMPAVLIVEALAQAAGILSFKSIDRLPDADTVYYFVGIDNARFKRPVVPGDQLVLEAEMVRKSPRLGKYVGRAFVDGQLAAEAELLCTLRRVSDPSQVAAV